MANVKPQQTTIRVPKSYWERFKRVAFRHGMNRNERINELIRVDIETFQENSRPDNTDCPENAA